MINDASIFTIYESILQNIIKFLLTVYQSKTTVPGKSTGFSYMERYVVHTVRNLFEHDF